MKAIHVDQENRTLHWKETPTPLPGPGEVRIKVHATACNRADLLQRRGLYPPPKGASPILGLEASGIVDAIGEGVQDWALGDKVAVLLAGGGYAEYITAPAALLLPIPAPLSLTEAAAIPEVFYTAFLNLFLEAGLQPGEIVLVHAAASGVGTAAVQLCKAFDAAVIGTASRTKIEFLEKIGLDLAIDRESEDFARRVDEFTDHSGVDVILDPVGADYFSRNLHLLREQGRMVLIGLLSGADAEISLGRLLRKRLRVIGSVLRSRSLEEKIAITNAFKDQVLPLFENGSLHPVIDRALPITEAESAHELLQKNKTIGKVVLIIDDSL